MGAGLSVTTWAPWTCLIGDDVVPQTWAQLILLVCTVPMACVIAVMSLPLSRFIWRGTHALGRALFRIFTSAHCCGEALIAERASATPFRNRFLVSLSLLLYAMLLGCFRTAVLGSIAGYKPGGGSVTFRSDVNINVSQRTHSIVRFASISALAIMG